MSAPRTPPGWYPDPWQHGWIRYWNGATWSPDARPAGPTGQASPYQPYAPVPGRPEGRTVPLRKWWPAVIAAAMVPVLLLLFLVVALADDGDPESTEFAADPSAEPTPSLEPEPEPEPEPAVVPALVGLDLDEAEADLHEAGLDVAKVKRKPSAEPKGTILKQRTDPGTELEPGSSVVLVVAAPYPRVPDVVGAGEQAAVSRLEEAGFSVRISTETRTSGVNGDVLGQVPGGGDRIKPGSVVEVVVLEVEEPPPPPVPLASNCTPGYDPCLAPAPDYDCAGGSGNGPAYANGPIRVTGSDPYDLDRDGDGWACER